MANCPICKLPDPQVQMCNSDASHLVHRECLQDMLDSVGADVKLLKCQSCEQALTLRTILDYQRDGIVVKNKLEMIAEFTKRRLRMRLPAGKIIA